MGSSAGEPLTETVPRNGPSGRSASGPVIVTRPSVTPATWTEKRSEPGAPAAAASTASSGAAKRSTESIAASHAEHAELRLRNRRVVSRRERQDQSRPRFRGIEHAVVPQACGGVIGMAFDLVLLARGPLELGDLLPGHRRLARASELVLFHRREDGGGLGAAHDGDAGVGPHEE